MKAIICTKYGPPLEVLKLKEVETPVPTSERVLVRVHAASINVADLAPVRGALIARLLGTGLLRPKTEILGTDIAGRVEAVGANVQRFQPGDEVFGAAPGAFAEYASAREYLLVLKPANVTYEASAAVPVAAISALQAVRKGRIQPGQKVLVYGASGGVGQFALQIAKSFGTEVTAVCSTQNLDNARSMGADRILDYTRQGFTLSGQTYDLILAVNGYQSMPAYASALTPEGICVVVGGKLAQILQCLLLAPLVSRTRRRKIGFMGIAKLNQADMVTLKELLESGKIRPVIDRRYPLSEAAEAVSYLEQGHARGKVIITVEP
jgi:NADPH:quinone reductase-like Zn-dependent oxidoreductase